MHNPLWDCDGGQPLNLASLGAASVCVKNPMSYTVINNGQPVLLNVQNISFQKIQPASFQLLTSWAGGKENQSTHFDDQSSKCVIVVCLQGS